MNVTDFTQTQREALIDLLVLGMYADGHLALAEDARLQQLLTTLGHESQYDRGLQLDAAVTRVRQHLQTSQSTRAHAGELAQRFTTREQRRRAAGLLEELMASDTEVSPPERRFVSMIREVLQM